MSPAFRQWASTATPLAPEKPFAFPDSFDVARIIVLAEVNHFVHQKSDFRRYWLRQLARDRKLVIAEELGWCDGRRVDEYITQRDDAALDHAMTFGYQGHARPDRDDTPQGVFGQAPYPHALMRAEHERLYLALRDERGIARFIGFDMDIPGAGYADLNALRPRLSFRDALATSLAQVTGESLAEEAARLTRLRDTLSPVTDIDDEAIEVITSMIETLRYTAMIQYAESYEAVAPAMAYREEAMKRRIARTLDRMPDDTTLVLMGHAFHLAKDDRHIQQQGIGPGGNQVSSLGHYLARERGEQMASIWMIYGQGTDSQPLPDLPQSSHFTRNSLNHRLAQHISRPSNLVTSGAGSVLRGSKLGHLYGMEVKVDLDREPDILSFYPQVTPLEG